MKTRRVRATAVSAVLLAVPSLALAHPGHDGDHGLTWDFSHLAAHPLATALGALVLVGAVWGGAQLAATLAERRQSLRKSAASRGK
jgi:hydrogenase/urease accessory protein HupE